MPNARRRLIPVTTTAVGIGWVWWSGMAWPIITTAWSLIAPRRGTPETEDHHFA